MATLLRPPLVFDRRQKTPIGFADIPPNLIASTLRNDVLTLKQPAFSIRLSDSAPPRIKQTRFWETPNLLTGTLFQTTEKFRLQMEQWDDSAPPLKLQIRIDPYPNLLENTLAPVGTAIPLPLAALRLDESVPKRKGAVLWDVYPRPLTLGINPNAQVASLDISAPPRKTQVFVENLSRPLTLGINPNAAVAALDTSAPPRKVQIPAEQQLNLLTTTLSVVAPPALDLPLLAQTIDESAPQAHEQVFAEQFVGRAVWRDPVPAVQSLHTSAFAAKYQVVAQQLDGRRVWLDPVPQVQRLDGSAWLPERAVYVDPPTLLTLRLSLIAVPNVVGELQAQADADLIAAGFVPVDTTAYDPVIPVGTVVSQNPVGGTLSSAGSSVTIVVSLGPQPIPDATQKPAGRKHRRRYIIEIDGRDFEVESVAHAQALLEQAREVALRTAPDVAERVAQERVRANAPVHTPAPIITTDAEEIRPLIVAARKAITDIYRKAAVDAEIRLRLERKLREDDEDDDEVLLLI